MEEGQDLARLADDRTSAWPTKVRDREISVTSGPLDAIHLDRRTSRDDLLIIDQEMGIGQALDAERDRVWRHCSEGGGRGSEEEGGRGPEWESGRVGVFCVCIDECPQIWVGWMDIATDARVRLQLQTRQLPTNPQEQCGRGRLGPQRLAATVLAMVMVLTICQERE